MRGVHRYVIGGASKKRTLQRIRESKRMEGFKEGWVIGNDNTSWRRGSSESLFEDGGCKIDRKKYATCSGIDNGCF